MRSLSMRKFRLALLAAIAALAAVSATLALAAAAAPAVTTAAATSITNTSATFNGSVNPGGTATQYAFQFGPTSSYGEETPLTSAGSGSAASAVSAAQTGLQPGTVYHFRLIALSAAGTSVGSDQSFTTTGSATASNAPSASTSTASAISANGATLNGSFSPNGQATSYYFEFGPTINYGYVSTPQGVAGSSAGGNVTATLSSLTPGTTYHYQIVAVNPGGVALGGDETFTTANPPAATTSAASDILDSSANLNGTVNPSGAPTSYYFQYGTTTAYGLQTAPADAGSGTGAVAVHVHINGLSPTTAYHYRLVAVNDGGTVYGADQTLTTSTATSTVKLMGHMGFVSPGYIVGVEIGCFGPAPCQGTFKATVGGAVIGTGSFKQGSQTGGFQNIKLNTAGQQLLRGNRPNHLLAVNVLVSVNGGQTINGSLSFATWYWKDYFTH